ncbi:transposable element Tcb2 transposase [Trichonephila clavipes]|nr:transposable element Tcb2 transposase [Trichonephila clavipes]
MCSRRYGGGRVRSTTPAEDKYIVLSAKRNRRTTAQQVANQFLAASGKQISRKLLPYCREHHNWTEQDWACVLFSDESRFSLSSDCRRQLIWRESGTAYRPENIQEKDRYPTCSIMVWAGIMINGLTRLHVVANGTMTGQRYIDEVLLPHDCLDSEGIQRLVWPARSPDLNPIENVRDALGRQVAGRNYPPTHKNTLIHALTKEWDKLPQYLLDNFVQSLVEVFCRLFQALRFRLKNPQQQKHLFTREFLSPQAQDVAWTEFDRTSPRLHQSFPTQVARLVGGVILGSRTALYIQIGTMTRKIYRNVILEQYVCLFRATMITELVFMDKNARPHLSNSVIKCLRSEDITCMDRLAFSPDLNPVEHACRMSYSPLIISYMFTGTVENIA